MTAADPLGFQGTFVKRGLIRVPVIDDPPANPPCINCGQPSLNVRCGECRENLAKRRAEHVPSHSAYNLHKAHGQTPCWDCQVAEKAYQHRRYLAKKAKREGTA